MKLPDNVYAFLKWFALIALPAFGTFYAVVGIAWKLPYVEEIKTTALALGTFIGVCIGVSSYSYDKERDNGNG